MIFVRFSFCNFLKNSVLYCYMFVSDKKTYQNRGKFGVLARFLIGGGVHPFGVIWCKRLIPKNKKFKNKNFKKRKKEFYQLVCNVIRCCIPLNLWSNLACATLNMLEW